MPDWELSNGSTVTIMQPDGTQREVNAERITINSDAVPLSSDINTIYATSSNGSRLVNWDINPVRYSGGGGGGNLYANMVRTPEGKPTKQYIKSYNYIPEQFMFHKVNNEEELYLGIELEIDSGGEDNSNAEYVCSFMNSKTENVYCKHDGSLNNGFEIVTHPCTIEYHKQLNYEELFKELIKRGYRSHDVSTCGLHVHINRDYFGEKKIEQDLNISKLLYLYEKYWDKVELVARRKSNRFAKRFLLEEDETPLDLYAKSKESDKYGAINLQHKNTVELRIFKGTLKLDTYLNTLEFVKVIANIAKESDIYNIQFVTWDKIKSRFSDELNQYITDREDIVKKEDKEKVNTMIDDRVSMTSYANWGSPSPYISFNDLYTSSFIDTDQMVSVNIPSFEYDTTYYSRPERSEEEQVQIEINELRTKVRRSRNGLEITNLNRQIAELENKLRRLRRGR